MDRREQNAIWFPGKLKFNEIKSLSSTNTIKYMTWKKYAILIYYESLRYFVYRIFVYVIKCNSEIVSECQILLRRARCDCGWHRATC